MALAVIVALVAATAATAPAAAAKREGSIYFVRASENQIYSLGTIWTVDAGGGKAERLSPSKLGPTLESPSISPDGRTLAFTRTKGGDTTLWTMSVSGKNARMLAAAGTDVTTPSWSPDGHEIVFGASRELALIAADGTNFRALTSDGGLDLREYGPSFFPSGQTIAFSQGSSSEVFLFDIGTGSKSMLTVPGYAPGNLPDVAPNGLKITTNCETACLFSSDGTGFERFRHVGFAPEFSPDGKWIVGAGGDVTVRRLSSGKTTKIADPASDLFYFAEPTWGSR